jgi:hypothetical protein
MFLHEKLVTKIIKREYFFNFLFQTEDGHCKVTLKVIKTFLLL